MTHRRQWVDHIQSAPFFLWVIHESKNEVVGNGLNKRIHAIFWQLNFQSRIKSWIFSQERKYDLEELSVSPQQLLKTRQVRPHFIISLFYDAFLSFLLDCSMVWNTAKSKYFLVVWGKYYWLCHLNIPFPREKLNCSPHVFTNS